MSTPRVAVIIVSYNHARFFVDQFRTLDQVTYPRDAWKIWFIDNKSSDETVSVVRGLLDETETKTTGGVAVKFIPSETNTGFAGGNNICMREAMEEGFDFVYLLNPDTEVEPDFLEKAVAAAESDTKIGAVQSLLVLGQERALINSVGNAFHFLGFSYCVGYRDRVDSPAVLAVRETVPDIASASGAGVLFRSEALRKIGLFDETLFAYHEDVELSLRFQIAGWRVVLAPKSIVYHKYEFSRSIKKYYWMERNRWIVLLEYLRWPTLLLLAPMHLVMELGMVFFAIRSGWWREKVRVIRWFLSPKNLSGMWKTRRNIQRMRTISDSQLMRHASTMISYQEVDNTLLRRFGNPLMRWYWRGARALLWW
jgi:GT2 family glycosyltransferase